MDARAFASPKRLRPRRRDKPGHDGGESVARSDEGLGLWAPAFAGATTNGFREKPYRVVLFGWRLRSAAGW